MARDLDPDERKVVAQWLSDKATLDKPEVRASIPKDGFGFFLEDMGDFLVPLNIKNPYNYLKWAHYQNKKLKGEQDKENKNKDDKKKDNLDFNIIWEDELRNYTEDEKEWIIDKLIPTKSVCILTGKRGTLKTFLTLAISYAVALGNPFLDKFDAKKGKVIYLDKENGIAIMKKRTEMLRHGMNINGEKIDIGFICFSQIKLDKLGGVAAIESVIKEHKPHLLIVDTYRRSVSFDENDAGKVSTLFVDTLRPIVEKHNTSILLIHHNRKSSGHSEVADEMDEMRGSSDLANYADIILKTERRGKSLVLKQLKNRNAEEELPIKIKCEFSENSSSCLKLLYDGEFKKQSKSEKCCELLLLWINENDIKQFKTSDAKKIAFKKGVKESSFKYALNEMENKGVIKNVGFGLYNVE